MTRCEQQSAPKFFGVGIADAAEGLAFDRSDQSQLIRQRYSTHFVDKYGTFIGELKQTGSQRLQCIAFTSSGTKKFGFELDVFSGNRADHQ